jgi:APA family basic amino acid/polyamine antiporter
VVPQQHDVSAPPRYDPIIEVSFDCRQYLRQEAGQRVTGWSDGAHIGEVIDSHEQRRGLLRVLGTAFGLAIVVGATIGGGILGTPGSVAQALPNTALFIGVWLFGAVNALLGATAYSELGAMMPRSGGMYVFAHRAFGDGVGFFAGYADWINWSVSSAALIALVGEYLGKMIPALGGHPTITGFGIFVLIAAVQWLGVRWGGRTQEVTSVLKTAALLALVAAVFLLPHATAPAAPAGAAVLPHGVPLLLAFGVAMQGVIFSYDSYYAVVYCGEEIRDPGRAIPRSIFRGLLLVIATYLLLNVAFLAVVPVQQMAGDPFVGGTVARMLFGARGDTVIRLIMIVAVLGTVNAQIIAAPRVLLAMARDGLFPRQATRVNAGGTPSVALGLSLLLIAGFLFTGSFDAILGVDAFFIVVLYLVVFLSLFVLRRREPETARPYRAWGYPVVPGLAVLFAVALLVAMTLGDRRGAIITLALLLVSLPMSHVVRRMISKGER